MTIPGEHRATGRVLVSNTAGEYLFLLTHFDPEVGLPPRWITPGGGIEATETPAEAARRELLEETGLEIELETLGAELEKFSGRWDWADGENFHTYEDHFFAVSVVNLEIDKAGWTPEEHRDVLQIKWWSLAELETSTELISPPGLVEFLLSR